MDWSRRRVLICGTVLGAAACTRYGASKSAEPVVETAQGKIRGAPQDNGVIAFKGMRYAASTAGPARFLPPAPPPNWSGVQDALSYGDQSPQSVTRLADPNVKMSDDCLRINVWTPGLDAAKRPVMLWFHGGGFEAGAGSMPLYDGTRLAKRGDVVVATINHRLNVFGHCFLGDILGDEFKQSGNAGYLDLVAAMRWVRENIAGFGGDPDNVMIYGQSGGGRKVSLCYAGRDAAGLFHKGAIQSGSHLRVQKREQSNALAEALLAELGIVKADARKLQSIDVETLENAQRKVANAAGSRFSPVLDGVTFTTDPFLPQAPAVSAHLPLMVGSNRTELTNQLGREPGIFEMDEAQAKQRLAGYLEPGDLDEAWTTFRASRPEANPSEIFFTIASARGYGRDATILAEQRAKAGGPGKTYLYKLMWRQPVEGGRRVTQHSLDLPFVFDNVAAGGHMTGPETEATSAMVDNMANAWIAFARTGNPNNPSLPDWSPFDLDTPSTMLFDVPSRLESDPFHAERVFMERYPSQQDGGRALHRRDIE